MLFLAYAGNMRWRTRAGDEVAARLGEPLTKDLTAQALRTALDPAGQWVPAVLAAADVRLREVRRTVPDAGGLVIATDQRSARAYAAHLREISGEAPGRRACPTTRTPRRGSRRSPRPAPTGPRWMVAVRMVSEGVDVPRLAVGRVGDDDGHAAVLRPGRRPVRPGPASRRDGVDLPAERAAAAPLRRATSSSSGTTSSTGPRSADGDDLWGPEEDVLAAADRTRSTPEADELPFEAIESDASFDLRGVRRRRVPQPRRVGRRGRGRRRAVRRAGPARPARPGRGGRDGSAPAPPAARARPRRARRRSRRRRRPPRRSPRRARSCRRWSGPTPAGPARRTPSSTPGCARTCGGPAVPEADVEPGQAAGRHRAPLAAHRLRPAAEAAPGRGGPRVPVQRPVDARRSPDAPPARAVSARSPSPGASSTKRVRATGSRVS